MEVLKYFRHFLCGGSKPESQSTFKKSVKASKKRGPKDITTRKKRGPKGRATILKKPSKRAKKRGPKGRTELRLKSGVNAIKKSRPEGLSFSHILFHVA